MIQFSRSVRIIVIAVLLLAIGLMFFSSAGYGTALGAPPAQGGGTPTPTPAPRRIPPNQPALGLVYDGLEPGVGDVCRDAFRLRDSNRCTHGPDPAPPGVNISNRVAPATTGNAPSAATAIQCDGDGSSGYRTQVMYVRPSDHVDQYNTYAASFRQWATDADTIYGDSASETGGYRRLRYVHDGSCNAIVLNVVIPGTGNVNFNDMVSQLSALGYNSSNRKYMIFMDANLYCGIGSLNSDDSPSQNNSNNSGPDYARADSGCWSGSVIAHESMHNMGAVQLSAPHTSGGYHCVDEYDRMCYTDAPNSPPMQSICTNPSHERLFDCNHDDYFHTSPAGGSYLATHWNSANNRFLITAAPGPPPTLTIRGFLPFVIR